MRIHTPDESFITVNPEVVNTNVPFLIGIDTLDKEDLIANNIKNKLEKGKAGSANN